MDMTTLECVGYGLLGAGVVSFEATVAITAMSILPNIKYTFREKLL